MQRVSPFWRKAIKADTLRTVAYAQITTGINGGSRLLATLPILDGSITADVTNAQRRTLSNLQMVGTQNPDGTNTLTPYDASDILFPDGNEIEIFQGIRYPDNDPAYANAPTMSLPWVNNGLSFRGEVVPQGVFLMEGIEIDDTSGSLVISVQKGTDRSAWVSRSTFVQPGSSTASTAVLTVIQDILTAQVPNLPSVQNPYGITTTIATINWSINGDPWTAVQAAASGVGCDLYFKQDGSLVLEPVPNPASQPVVATFQEGSDCIVFDLKRILDNTKVPNRIIVTSQGSGTSGPWRSDWTDTNPSSPTYINGKYPTTVSEIQTSVPTSQADTDAVAQAAGYAAIGQLDAVQITLRGDPSLEENDVTKIIRTRALNPTKYITRQLAIQLKHTNGLVLTGASIT